MKYKLENFSLKQKRPLQGLHISIDMIALLYSTFIEGYTVLFKHRWLQVDVALGSLLLERSVRASIKRR